MDAQTKNSLSAMQRGAKKGILGLAQFVVIVGICYVIVAPILGILVSSFMSDGDAYNPMVYMIPTAPTFQKYKTVIARLNYFPTMGRDLLYTLSLMVIQVLICSMVGYGFARFNFPFKKLFICLRGCDDCNSDQHDYASVIHDLQKLQSVRSCNTD